MAATGTTGDAIIGKTGIENDGIMKFDVIVGFVEIEYGVRMVGDCIIENGDVTVGVTLIVGITRNGFGALALAAAAAAALLFLLPAAADEADDPPAADEAAVWVVVVLVTLVVADDAAAPEAAELLDAAAPPYPAPYPNP